MRPRMSHNEHFVSFTNINTVAGAATVVKEAYGILISADIILEDSASLDIVISRILPGGAESILYEANGLIADTLIGKDEFTPPVAVLSGNIKVEISNAGNHTNACEVFLTVL